MKKIKVILGSTREPRNGIKVANWFMEETKKYNNNIEFELLDLRVVDLPHYNEPGSPMSNPNYKNEATRNWGKKIDEADGFIFITPEYNGYFTGALKDAVDYLYHEWVGKPYFVVGYGSRGAKRAVSQLHNLLFQFKMIDLQTDIAINNVWDAFNEKGILNEKYLEGKIEAAIMKF